jgi:hypothetical protein
LFADREYIERSEPDECKNRNKNGMKHNERNSCTDLRCKQFFEGE